VSKAREEGYPKLTGVVAYSYQNPIFGQQISLTCSPWNEITLYRMHEYIGKTHLAMSIWSLELYPHPFAIPPPTGNASALFQFGKCFSEVHAALDLRGWTAKK
jgi:hypothetical protein